MLAHTRNLLPITLPATDHPLYSLALHYHTLRSAAQEAERQYEGIAPTPLSMAGDDPADKLTGALRDTYYREFHRCADLTGAAKSAFGALMDVADALGEDIGEW